MTHARMASFAGLLIAVALTTSACQRPASRHDQPDFFPLYAEATWVYEIARPTDNARTRMTVRVRGERYIRPLGRQCRLVEESYSVPTATRLDEGATDTEMYPVAYCNKDGFLSRTMSLEYRGSEVQDAGLGSGEERFLPLGLNGGLTWESITTAYDLGDGNGYGVRQRHRAIRDPGVVEVPAGRFRGCVRVDTVAFQGGRHNGRDDGDPLVLYYSDWYAPNVGLVRTVHSNRLDSAPAARIELLSYNIGRREGH